MYKTNEDEALQFPQLNGCGTGQLGPIYDAVLSRHGGTRVARDHKAC